MWDCNALTHESEYVQSKACANFWLAVHILWWKIKKKLNTQSVFFTSGAFLLPDTEQWGPESDGNLLPLWSPPRLTRTLYTEAAVCKHACTHTYTGISCSTWHSLNCKSQTAALTVTVLCLRVLYICVFMSGKTLQILSLQHFLVCPNPSTGPNLASWSPCPSWPSEPRPQLHTSVSKDGRPSVATSQAAAWNWPAGDDLQPQCRCRRGDPNTETQAVNERWMKVLQIQC